MYKLLSIRFARLCVATLASTFALSGSGASAEGSAYSLSLVGEYGAHDSTWSRDGSFDPEAVQVPGATQGVRLLGTATPWVFEHERGQATVWPALVIYFNLAGSVARVHFETSSSAIDTTIVLIAEDEAVSSPLVPTPGTAKAYFSLQREMWLGRFVVESEPQIVLREASLQFSR
jgi:hypothetical protein